MNLDHTLQVLICLGVIYFLLSNLVSILFEWYAYKTNQRGNLLYTSIISLINDSENKSYGKLLYALPQIDRLKKEEHCSPQYISADMFADAFIDVIGQQSTEINYEKDALGNLTHATPTEKRINDPHERFRAGVETMNKSPFKELLRSLHEKNTTYPSLKRAIANWYNDHMDRVTGWYKIHIKKHLFFIALIISLLLNIDSFRLVKTLNTDNELRKSIFAKADGLLNKPTNANYTLVDSINNSYYFRHVNLILDSIEVKSLPVGWNAQVLPLVIFKKENNVVHSLVELAFWLLGILLSSVAMSFGAPFWFSVLNNLVNIRRAGVKPDKLFLNEKA